MIRGRLVVFLTREVDAEGPEPLARPTKRFRGCVEVDFLHVSGSQGATGVAVVLLHSPDAEHDISEGFDDKLHRDDFMHAENLFRLGD
jgi:hypothetical protein